VNFQSENVISKVTSLALFEVNVYVFVRHLHQNIA